MRWADTRAHPHGSADAVLSLSRTGTDSAALMAPPGDVSRNLNRRLVDFCFAVQSSDAPVFQPSTLEPFRSPLNSWWLWNTAAERHVGAVTDRLQETPQHSSLRSFLPEISCSARTVTSHFGIRTYNRSFLPTLLRITYFSFKQLLFTAKR